MHKQQQLITSILYLVLPEETHKQIWESIEECDKNEELSRKNDAQEKIQQTRLVWLEGEEKLKREHKFKKKREENNLFSISMNMMRSNWCTQKKG